MANINNGTVTVQVVGGVGPYQYTLLNAGTNQPIPNNAYPTFQNPVNNIVSNTFTFGNATDNTGNSGLAPGQYKVKIVDSNLCETVSNTLFVTDITPIPPTATPVPVPTATILPTATAIIPTATPVPAPTATAIPDPTATPVPDPTATAIPEPTATAIPDPTATPVPDPTATEVIPTATPVPAPTATAIPVPTATPVPAPTATAIPAPTATPVPAPTATPVPAPTATPAAEALPTFWWHWNGTEGYPAVDSLTRPTSDYILNNNEATTNFNDVFLDMVAFTGADYNVQTMSSSAFSAINSTLIPVGTLNFIGNAPQADQNYYIAIPVSVSNVNYTTTAAFADAANGVPFTFNDRLAFSYLGNSYMLYQIYPSPNGAPLSLNVV